MIVQICGYHRISFLWEVIVWVVCYGVGIVGGGEQLTLIANYTLIIL